MNIISIIFDFGGVLVRTEDHRPRAILADSLGLTYAQLEDLVFNSQSGKAAQLGLVTPEENWENVRLTLGLSPEEIPATQAAFFGGDVLDRALVDYIKSIPSQYQIALLSNYTTRLRSELESVWEIHSLFDPIIISAEVGVMKPDPRIYEIALETIGVKPNEAVFIDDFPHNIEGALNVGMHGILFNSREQLIRDLQSLINQ